MTDEVQATETATASAAVSPGAQAPETATVTGGVSADPPAVSDAPATGIDPAKVTALHLAIDHAGRHQQHSSASEVVELAERFWQWLVKEARKIA